MGAEGPVLGLVESPGMSPVEAVPEKVNRPGTFKKGGDPRSAQSQRKAREAAAAKAGPPPDRVPVEAASNPMLTVYRHILANPDPRVDVGTLERETREFLWSHRKEFLAQYSEMEVAEGKRLEVAVGTDGEEGSSRDLLGKLLAEFKGV